MQRERRGGGGARALKIKIKKKRGIDLRKRKRARYGREWGNTGRMRALFPRGSIMEYFLFTNKKKINVKVTVCV